MDKRKNTQRHLGESRAERKRADCMWPGLSVRKRRIVVKNSGDGGEGRQGKPCGGGIWSSLGVSVVQEELRKEGGPRGSVKASKLITGTRE